MSDQTHPLSARLRDAADDAVNEVEAANYRTAADALDALQQRIAEAAVNCPSCGRHDFGLFQNAVTLKAQLDKAEADLAALRQLHHAYRVEQEQRLDAQAHELTEARAVLDATAPLEPGESVPLPERIRREMADLAMVIRHASIVFDHVTGGRISKVTTLPEVVIAEADAVTQAACDEAAKEAVEVAEEAVDDGTTDAMQAEIAELRSALDAQAQRIAELTALCDHDAQQEMDLAVRLAEAEARVEALKAQVRFYADAYKEAEERNQALQQQIAALTARVEQAEADLQAEIEVSKGRKQQAEVAEARVEQAERERDENLKLAVEAARRETAAKDDGRGYRCYHCGFVFHDQAAHDHFGAVSNAAPGCLATERRVEQLEQALGSLLSFMDAQEDRRDNGEGRDATLAAEDFEPELAAIRALLARPEADRKEHSAVPPADLDAASIRTGCETAANREADRKLRELGYVFDATEQRWLRPAAPAPREGTEADRKEQG